MEKKVWDIRVLERGMLVGDKERREIGIVLHYEHPCKRMIYFQSEPNVVEIIDNNRQVWTQLEIIPQSHERFITKYRRKR